MKALSIKQPFASLIAHGIKDIENRTWKTNYRGRIYIHASSTPSKLDLTKDQYKLIDEAGKRLGIDLGSRLWMDRQHRRSVIIGEVTIADCVINHPSIWAEKSSSYSIHEPGGIPASLGCKGNNPIYNWVLENAVLYNEPILNVKGRLSLWEY